MADRGYVIIWLDPGKDKDKAWIAVNERFPEYEYQFLNPRYFTAVDSTGVDARKVRGHVLATEDEKVYKAYVEAEVEFVDMRKIPERKRTEPECVVIYTKPDENEWNAACRAVARSTFPGMVVRPIQIAKYDGPVIGNVVAVVVPDDAQKIADDYGRMHKQVVRVPRPGGPVDGVGKGPVTIDADVIAAALQLPIPNLRAVVASQTSAEWLQKLADAEAADGDRQEAHEAINTKLANLGSKNPHFVVGLKDDAEGAGEPAGDAASPPEDDSSKEAPEAAPEAAALPSRDMTPVADMSVRKVGEALKDIDDLETLGAMKDSEVAGKNRDTVVALIERRIRAKG